MFSPEERQLDADTKLLQSVLERVVENLTGRSVLEAMRRALQAAQARRDGSSEIVASELTRLGATADTAPPINGSIPAFLRSGAMSSRASGVNPRKEAGVTMGVSCFPR